MRPVDVFHPRWWRKSVPIAPLRSSGVAGTKTPQLAIPRFPLFGGPGLHHEYIDPESFDENQILNKYREG